MESRPQNPEFSNPELFTHAFNVKFSILRPFLVSRPQNPEFSDNPELSPMHLM